MMKTTTTVFRVQDKHGRGPWKPGFSHRWAVGRTELEYAALAPWPIEFGNVLRRPIAGMSVGSGCLTIDQLLRWFTPAEYKTLLGFGYSAVKMEADRILAHSEVQCVFERVKPLREEAEVIELYPAEVVKNLGNSAQ